MDKLERFREQVSITRSFNIRLHIDTLPENVFHMLTTADGLNAWWTDASAAAAREGGKVEYVWHVGNESVIGTGIYRKFRSPEYFEVEYLDWKNPLRQEEGFNFKDAYPGPVIHQYELRETEPGTTSLFIRTAGIYFGEKFDDLFEATRSGWLDSLANLKSVCETGKDLR